MTNPKSFKSIGAEFSPTKQMGVDAKRNRVQQLNDLSQASLNAILAKHGKPSGIKVVRTVDSSLRVHSHIM